MPTVKLTEILDYYDGIQIFAAQDPFGCHYVCDMVDTVGDFDRYVVVVVVRPERLDDFRTGRVDLRTLQLESPYGEWYITTADGTIDDPLILELRQEPLMETDYLPDEGFFLRQVVPVTDAPIGDRDPIHPLEDTPIFAITPSAIRGCTARIREPVSALDLLLR